MEHKLSSTRRPGELSASGSDSDPEREFSGNDDDDDRNHKHRRREIRSQSSEYDASQSVSSRTFNKRKKPFENGHPFRGNVSRTNGGWKNNTFTSSESEIMKSDKRHFDLPMFSRPQMDVNQRIGLGQTYFGDSGFAHGRGRESWNPHAPRFGSMEFSQIAPQGSVSSNMFAVRGLPNVAGLHTAPWNPYGILPGIPGGGLDAMHSRGVNSTLRPPIIPALSTGIIHQKCRDFEERGFCLRGDMCPMEHGVNRIVVDDVQSLSKFNLPVSLSGGNMLGVGGGSGPLPAGTSSTSFSVNNTKFQRKIGKSKRARKGTNIDAGCNGPFSSTVAAGNDCYDPDQPSWNKNGPDSLTVLSQPSSPEIQLAEPTLDGDPSTSTPGEIHNGSGIHPLSRSARRGVGTDNLAISALGNRHGSNCKSDLKGSMVPNLSGHNDYTRGSEETSNNNQATSGQGMHVSSEDKDTNVSDASQRRLNGSSHNTQKPLQKAMRTIFVNGVPQKDNNKEALKSHFQKFGEIIDIYIPSNSERAFVQFSTREEAEAALKAPDAVMGNRFIKLWWANRDSIPDPVISNANNPYISPLVGTAYSGPLVGTAYSGPTQLSVSSRGRSNQPPAPKANATYVHPTTPKVNGIPVSSAPFPVLDQGKHIVTAGRVDMAPSQKKLENLEVLKEELRKKQGLLEQKRNEFKRQLDRLEKQAAGVKGELSSEQHAKRRKVVMPTDVAKRLASQSADISSSATLSRTEEVAEKTKPVEKLLANDPSRASTLLSQQATSLKMLTLPLAETEKELTNRRSKLNNQPKAFRIVPPLPSDLADVVTLREHFSAYGQVYDVELVNVDNDERRAALISFNTHLSAEKAFQSAKRWKGNDLQFTWVAGNINEHDKFLSSATEPMDVDIASENNGLQEAVAEPNIDFKAASTNSTDKFTAPDENPSPHEEMLKDQPFEDDAEKVHNNTQPANEDVAKHEKQLSEDDLCAEKTHNEKSSGEDSLKALKEQSSDEDVERAHNKHPSEDDSYWTLEEQPSNGQV